jgi:exonuclease SbcC
MHWLRKLLKKPVTRPHVPAAAESGKKTKPDVDISQLRSTLVAAPAGEEQARHAARLGQVLGEAGQRPLAEDPPQVWIAAVCHGADKTLALDWSAQLTDDALLGEVATRARIAEVRFAAARRIESMAVLEHVAHASRDKDKRVYRHCADLLRQRRQAEESARQAGEIAEELRGLLDRAPLPQPRLTELKKALSNLAAAGDACAECDALLEQGFGRLRQEAEARRELQARLHAAQALAAECEQAAWPWSGLLEGWRERLYGLRQAGADQPGWLAEEAASRALAASLEKIEARLERVAADEARFQAADRFLAALDADAPPDADTVAGWNALDLPEHALARQALATRWQALQVKTQSPPEPEPVLPPEPLQPPRRIDQAALRDLLDQLELAITEGHLQDADTVTRQIRTLLDGEQLHGALESRLHLLQAQLESLHGWARWGSDQARDKLIAAAQELLQGEREVEGLARDIAALREEWKRLNAQGSASKSQWESFDAALTQAYQPVAAHREAQAERLAEARAAREALCLAWEGELAGIDWEQADFKAAEARRVQLYRQWREAPHASFRDERILRKRFDELIATLDQRLEAARTLERERREQLIAAAEALREQTDLRQAMAEAKALQQRWNQGAAAVRLKRGEEQKLWQRFRTACNDVFARRDAFRAEQAAQRLEQAQSREKLLDALAAAIEVSSAEAIKQAMKQFRTDWEALRPAKRDADVSQESRAQELQRQAQQRLDALRHERYQARLELLARKAALAASVEAAVLSAEPLEPVMAAAREAWDALPHLPGKSESLLVRRLTAASQVTRADLAAGREARAALLLDLEMALGLPSPQRFAEVRRERQLERLQNRFGTASEEGMEPEALLARWHAIAALPDASFEPRIAAVVRQLVAQTASRKAA